MTTTDRSSIAELQRAFDRDTFSDEATLIDAVSVLLEIAAAARVSRFPVVNEAGEREQQAALAALDVALAKVRP